MLLPIAPTPLAHYRDKARPILIFTPTAADPRFLDQFHMLESHTPELAERQAVVLVFAQHPYPWPRPAGSTVWPGNELDPARIRKTYRIAPGDFTVILVGKDGGEKLRSHQPIPFDTLQSTIDSMPMRLQEMRHPSVP